MGPVQEQHWGWGVTDNRSTPSTPEDIGHRPIMIGDQVELPRPKLPSRVIVALFDDLGIRWAVHRSVNDHHPQFTPFYHVDKAEDLEAPTDG